MTHGTVMSLHTENQELCAKYRRGSKVGIQTYILCSRESTMGMEFANRLAVELSPVLIKHSQQHTPFSNYCQEFVTEIHQFNTICTAETQNKPYTNLTKPSHV